MRPALPGHGGEVLERHFSHRRSLALVTKVARRPTSSVTSIEKPTQAIVEYCIDLE